MAQLPDPTDSLSPDDRAAMDAMAQARAHAEGRPQLGDTYVRMFNNPGVARAVGTLGEYLRFQGNLRDDVRELAILRHAAQNRCHYEWAHHVRPGQLAGLDDALIAALAEDAIPPDLTDPHRAVVEVADTVAAGKSLPADLQARIVDAYGNAGVVELVVLCGLYSLMECFVTAFDVAIEDGLPEPPF